MKQKPGLKSYQYLNQLSLTMQNKSRAIADSHWWCLLVVALLSILCLAGLVKPSVGWDVLGYTGSALQMNSSEHIHKRTYELTEAAFPDDYQALLVDDQDERTSTYRSVMAKNASAFQQQLPYYQIRPLYVSMLTMADQFGLSPAKAMVWISMVATFGIGCLVYLRLLQALPALFASLVCCSLLLIFRFQDFAGMTTVDPLIAVAFIAFVFHFERGLGAFGMLGYIVVMLLIRSNSIIFFTPFIAIGALNHVGHWSATRLKPLIALGIFVVALLVMKAIEMHYHNYGWWTVFSFTFIESMNFPAEFKGTFDLMAYGKVILSEARWLLSDHYVTLFYLTAVVLLTNFILKPATRNTPFMLLSSLAFLSIFLGHFLLFPAVLLRFFLPVFLLASVYAVIGCIGNPNPVLRQ